MYARVVTGRVEPEKIDRALTILERDIRPLLAARPGFASWSLLIEDETGRFQVITFWGSLVEAQGASRDGFSDRAGMLAGLLGGELDQGIYDVRQ